MEKKFYNDDFEHFLKETTDDFRMYPSRKVWNGLYNDLHPGQKWPSLSVCLILISSVIFIGVSHRNEISAPAANVALNKAVSTTAKPEIPEQSRSTQTLAYLPNQNRSGEEMGNRNENIPEVSNGTGSIPSTAIKQNTITTSNIIGKGNLKLAVVNSTPESADEQSVNNKSSALFIVGGRNTSIIEKGAHPISEKSEGTDVVMQQEKVPAINEIVPKIISTSPIISSAFNDFKIEEKNISSKPTTSLASNKKPVVSAVKKAVVADEWAEDYAFHHLKKPSAKSRSVYQLYVTPSVGFRRLAKLLPEQIQARSSLLSGMPEEVILDHTPSFNLEAGYNVLYSYSKAIRLKGGLQFNYSSYRIGAQDLGHTTQTSLLLKNQSTPGVYLENRSTTLANSPGHGTAVNLNSNTYQLSLPFGADLKLLGKNRIQWYAGATLQPTYILFGNAYLISADEKNYVFDANFIRKWNINAGVETFVTYKTNKGITLTAGPQLRYQFLSTYKNKYGYYENLYNVGLKVGVIQNF